VTHVLFLHLHYTLLKLPNADVLTREIKQNSMKLWMQMRIK